MYKVILYLQLMEIINVIIITNLFLVWILIFVMGLLEGIEGNYAAGRDAVHERGNIIHNSFLGVGL